MMEFEINWDTGIPLYIEEPGIGVFFMDDFGDASFVTMESCWKLAIFCLPCRDM